MTQPEIHSQINSSQSKLRRFLFTESMVAPDPVTDRALIAVIVILTFMAALTIGLVQYATAVTARWKVVLASEVTIQIRPQVGRDIEVDLKHAQELLRSLSGVTHVKIYPKEDTVRLLEPWLGSTSVLESLPIPRIIAVQISTDDPPDVISLGQSLAREIPGLSVDDHRTWTRRLNKIGETLIMSAIAGLSLVMMAAAMAIIFATRGAMAGNRPIIEVLYYIGAEDRYIARVFQRHFFGLGLIGGLIGGILALAVLLILRVFAGSSNGFMELFGLGGANGLPTPLWSLIMFTLSVVGLVSFLAAFVSRITVYRTVGKFE